MTKNKGLCEFNKKTKKGCYQEGGREYSNTQENTKCYSISSVLITLLLDSVRHLHMAVRFYLIVYVKKGHKWVTTDAESALSFDITWSKAEAVTSCLYYSSNLIFSSIHSFFFYLWCGHAGCVLASCQVWWGNVYRGPTMKTHTHFSLLLQTLSKQSNRDHE